MAGPNTIGVVEAELVGLYYRNVLLGVHTVARAHGAQCLLFQGSLQELQARQLALRVVSGWVAVLPTEDAGELAWGDTPVVTVDARLPQLGCPAVFPDNHGGMAMAVHHLLDHGHREIGFVGYLAQSDIQERYAGYQAALAERGIPFNAEFVFSATDNVESGGRAAGQCFVEAGRPCTALVVATDLNAIGVIEVLQTAGYHIPADTAIIGFDNIATAQYTSPPLTTIGQQFDALGSAAAQLLLEQNAYRDTRAGVIQTQTRLIPRRSCGCSGAQLVTSTNSDRDFTTADWQEALSQELMQLVHDQLSINSATASRDLWPGRRILVEGLDAALHVRPEPADADLERAWQEICTLTSEIGKLQAIWKLLQRAGAQQCAAQPADPTRTERLAVFLDRAAMEMMRAHRMIDLAERAYLDRLVQTNYDVSAHLLTDELEATYQLTWLRQVGVRWGCLGLWSKPRAGEPPALMIAGHYRQDTNAETLVGQPCEAADFPPIQQLSVVAGNGGSDLVVLLPVRTAIRDWGLLAVCTPIDGHTALALDYLGMWTALLGNALDRGSMVVSMKQQQETLQIGYERERALAQAVRELGCPVIPLLPNVLLIPLIGLIDAERARQILEAVLQGVSHHQAQTVLLDVTGVPMVDTHVANTLIQVARTASLLGSHVILVGIRPEIAQSIVGLGIGLEMLSTQPTLATAVEALRHGRKPTQRGTLR